MKSIATITIERDDGETYVFDNVATLSLDIDRDIEALLGQPKTRGFNDLTIDAELFPEELKEED